MFGGRSTRPESDVVAAAAVAVVVVVVVRAGGGVVIGAIIRDKADCFAVGAT